MAERITTIRPDHNADTLTPEQKDQTIVRLKGLRRLLKGVEKFMRVTEYQGADLMLALRAVEDARMRLGKALQPFDTGFVQTDEPDNGVNAAINQVIYEPDEPSVGGQVMGTETKSA